MDTLDFLERVDLFKGMGDDRIEAIQSCCETGEFKRGERIFRPGEDARFLYILMEGLVELRKEAQNQDNAQNAEVISRVSAGDVFGWSALVPPYKYSLAAYIASRTSKVLKLERECFTKLMESDVGIGYPVMTKILVLIGRRFDEMEERVIKRLGQDMINDW
jgi:CRP/FNR family transcriptional regulator, cyclic AMP receptor protein